MVVGAGSVGLVTSYIAATVRAKVALIEKHKMGGDCLNTGCVPSKALIRNAKMLSYTQRAKEFGFKSSGIDFDFSNVMKRVHDVIKKVGHSMFIFQNNYAFMGAARLGRIINDGTNPG